VKRSVRFPLFCTRCSGRDHYVEDCKRMPASMGLSQQERDLVAQNRAGRNAFLMAGLVIVLALVVSGAP